MLIELQGEADARQIRRVSFKYKLQSNEHTENSCPGRDFVV
jgi:hypothetical protein